MKRISLILVTAFCLAFPLYSYQPIVEPDLDYLPALLDSTIHFRREFESNERILEDRRIYTYDTYGNLKTSEINRNNSSLSVNTYDENGNQIECISYERDSEINDWAGEGNWKRVDTYNTSGLITGRIEYEWDPDGEEWRITAEYFAYWSELGTRIPVRTENQQIFVCPNPMYTFLTIETGISDQYNIEITSLNGQLLLSKEMEGTTHHLDLSSFRKGVYLITIRSNDFLTTRKIVRL